MSEFRISVSLHPTVLWRTYKRTQNNTEGLRGTSICGCVILNLHLPLNTHHPPFNTHTYQDRVGPQQMVPPTKGRVRPVALVCTHALTHVHQHIHARRRWMRDMLKEPTQEWGGELSGGFPLLTWQVWSEEAPPRVCQPPSPPELNPPLRAEKPLWPPAWPFLPQRGGLGLNLKREWEKDES